ncbi:hypothetical protein A2738_02600 [Candidatus Nomurabacteria bacterium RIFCSPHIGHO2_01_FULL_42_15]|uniref:Uncharacterized protein n=1 Tax=Candidatus Nomurabacteria bacterium RIFCSPHIGHO2_01_FULL_42_15 TaxID=1801742 RepID=A0A1F6VEP3_9BACT|nr:MAG: hypothetical protein A2738_02600 [Candidatus Nomurabacteria bacterium RIFCSPHIGHO2_01_FULL_42_15]OGI92763.1 MAG: hypothetical protein A3A99_02665 [Candidatus Nomurabacteria bacterium RIFCSPLOWO2_01_FULL_41_18]
MEKENKNNLQGAEIGNKIVQTYADDMVKVIEDDKTGLVKKIIHGEEQHEKEKRNLSPESKKNQFFMMVGGLFIILGVVTLVYFFSKTKVPTVPVGQQFSPIIFLDQSTFIEVKDLKKEKIMQAVVNAVNATEVKNGGVEGIYLTYDKNKIIGLREFFTLIKANFEPKPDQPLTDGSGTVSFVSDSFLMGAVKNQTDDFFILLKVRSIADVFDTLRLWEDKMFLDLYKFLGQTVTTENNYLLTADFEDGIVGNKNARILYEKDSIEDRKIALMYVFADDNSVIITNTEKAVREIMTRLAAGQIKK